jgi:hypothetical protein
MIFLWLKYTSDTVWSAGAEYMLSRNVSLMGSYDNDWCRRWVVCQILKSIGINLFTSWIYSIEIIQIMVTACKMDLEMEEFGAQLSQRRGIDII